MYLRLFFLFSTFLLLVLKPNVSSAQVLAPNSKNYYYLIHSGGKIVGENNESRTVIKDLTGGDEQLLQFIPDGKGYYSVKLANQKKFMALSGSWNTFFVTDSTSDQAKYAIEKVNSTFIRLKCKSNNKYLGTDDLANGAYVYSDKSGTESKHYWYISEKYSSLPIDTVRYLINPETAFENSFEGWGVSLCWWANMCGKWDDNKIDELLDWLVSPAGLNYTIFRYNIGGGDDPLNRNCTPHHMANGKGLRAEMEGFNDSLNAKYDWGRDAAQRKIMLKIKEKRPDAVFEAFSNSAPYYMTYSGCCAGNISASHDNLKPEFYEAFSHYLVDVCQFYKDSFNIEFKTLAPFNEPVTNYWSANGGQEGCHFSTAEQIKFLKILSPILKASGLKTIISASDETSASQSVTDFLAYIHDGTVLDLVGQWNTHTYSANNQARANLRALSTAHHKTLWMSEVGAGGSGIGGNLNLAQKLMDDIRYIRPEAWVDWQYVEEGNDQWCMVKGNFSAQSYQRVKNYYVRQQFSRYIPAGSRFLAVPNDQMLAALNSKGDSLMVVIINNSSIKVAHKIDLTLFDFKGNAVEATRTSETENRASISDYSFTDSTLELIMPGYSISTFIIPLSASALGSINKVKTDEPYLILSRTASLVMQTDQSAVIINNYRHADSTQLWILSEAGNGFTIMNLAGEKLTDTGSYFLKATNSNTSGQIFQLEGVEDNFYKLISTSTGKVLDLEGASNTVGTKVGVYTYGDSPAASHRQWIFVRPPFSERESDTNGSEEYLTNSNQNNFRIFGAEGTIVVLQTPDSKGQITVYSTMGECLFQQKVDGSFLSLPWRSGIFLVSYQKGDKGIKNTTKVLVR